MLSASGCGVPDVSGSGADYHGLVSGSAPGDLVSGPVSGCVSGPVSSCVSGPVSSRVSGPVSGCVSGPGCIQTHSEDLHRHLHQLPAHLCGASGSRGASSGPGHRRDTSATASSGACRDAA
jgi:hypothetical protein